MTQKPRLKPKKPNQPPKSPSSGNHFNEPKGPPPYEMISLPSQAPERNCPTGHDRYLDKHLHGTLSLTLTVHTPVHISTGVVVMGSDIGSSIPLIKTMLQGSDRRIFIQGSSLKGCVRSAYEAITSSCLCKTKANKIDNPKSEIQRIPKGYSECGINLKHNKLEVCPACRIFGALNWQGLVEFTDIRCEKISFDTGLMPPLHAPQPQPKNRKTGQRFLNPSYFDDNGKILGRKFYYQFEEAINKEEGQGIAMQQTAKGYTFTTELKFKNLRTEELGTLLVILGQDEKHKIALKVGGGKPIGMGTMTVQVNQADILETKDQMLNRYLAYDIPLSNSLTGNELEQFIERHIEVARNQLIQSSQLDQLVEVLRYPPDPSRKPCENY